VLIPDALLAPSDLESNDDRHRQLQVIGDCHHFHLGLSRRAASCYGARVGEASTAGRRVGVEEAVSILRRGGLVALPTETVYGLGASALDPKAVARVFAVKRRPVHHPLIVHLADADHLPGWAEVPDAAWRLAERFWPGPLTVVLRRGPLALDAVTGGLATVGLRVPAHPLTQAVLVGLGGGIAAPSANRFGHVSPTTAEHVLADLGGEIDGVLDGGPCEVGIESTIVDLSGAEGEAPRVLRLGAVTPEAIAEVIGAEVVVSLGAKATPEGERASAPGQLASHYAPRARLELWPRDAIAGRVAALAGRAVVVLGDDELGSSAQSWARGLYAALRAADAAVPEVILVPVPPGGALAHAVRDRLERAAAPRA
jgi:L-threonylcarbamoyladenylate synthase